MEFFPHFSLCKNLIFKVWQFAKKFYMIRNFHKGAVNLSHWADRQANGLFAHPRSNVIYLIKEAGEIITFKNRYEGDLII